MLLTTILLVAFPFMAVGHMHIMGVPVVTDSHLGPHRRLFVPIDPNFCNAQEQQAPISCFQSTSGGTAYCSSFLSIPTITVCTTFTAPPAATTTITSTLGQTPVLVRSNAKRAEIIKAEHPAKNNAVSVRKRILLPRQVGGCVPATQSPPYTSSVCSCLNIPTPTTTTTFSYTPPPIVTRTVVITPSASQSSTALVGGSPQFTTITTLNTASGATAPITSTGAIPTGSGQTGTVFVGIPPQFTTVTVLNSAAGATGTLTSTAATPSIPGQVGTVIIQVAPQFTTVTALNTASTATAPVTLTASPTTAGGTGTVSVLIPPVFTTITTTVSGISVITTSTVNVPATLGQTGTVEVLIPISVTPSISTNAVSVSAIASPRSLPTNVCGIEGSNADGSCMSSLPAACQQLSSSNLLGTILSSTTLLACQTALGAWGTADALGCFTGNLVSSLTGANVYTCLQATLPMCSNCLSALPSTCTNLGTGTTLLDVTALAACQAALGSFGTAVGSLCFTVGTAVSSLTGQNVQNCLRQNIPICPSTTASTPTSLMATVTTTGCGGQATTTACITSLPFVCQSSGSGLLGTVVGSIDTVACQTALGVFGVTDAAVCFSTGLLNIFTGQDFLGCLNNHLPLCNACVSQLPSSCLVTGGALGSVCQAALGRFGDTSAANCFLNGVASVVVGTSLVSCLNSALPFCNIPSTTTRTSGLSLFTSTVTSVNSGLLGAGASTTTYILVNVPSPLSTSLTTFVGTTGYTSTITSTNGGLLGAGAFTTTYALVGVPITLMTSTITSGSTSRTTTITSAGTTFVEILVPTPLSTSYTTINGGTAFTSTITTTTPGGLLSPATTSSYVLIGVPTVYATSTITSGTVATVAPITTTLASPSTTFVEVIVPTPLRTTTITSGAVTTTSTVYVLSTQTILLARTTLTVSTYVQVAVPTA